MQESGDTAERLGWAIDELRRVFQSFPDLLFRLSLSGEILEFLGGPLADFNVAQEDFLGRRLREVLPEDVAALVERAIEEAMESGRAVTIEYPLDLNDQERFFESKVTRFLDDEILILSRDTTDRKRAEAELRRSEERWRSLTESAEDLIVSVDCNGRVLAVNRSASGVPLEDDIGLPVYDFIAPEHHSEVRQVLQKVFESGEQGRLEVLATGPFTTGLTFDVRVGPITENDQVLAATWIARDITDRKKTEAALRESLAMWRSLTESAEDFIVSVDREGKVLATNRTQSGIPVEEAVGLLVCDYIAAECHDEVRQALRNVFESRERVRFEIVAAGPTVEGMEFDVLVGPIIENDRVVAATWIARDITDRKKTEAALRESEEKFRSLMHTIAAAAFIYDGTRLVYVNAAAEALTGYNEDELLSMDPWDLIEPEFRESLLGQWDAYQRGETTRVRDEVKLLTKDRVERWADFSVGQFELRGAIVAIGTAFEITERKQAEAALERLREELEDKAERHVSSGNRYGLTFRELTVLGLVANGTPDKAIATVLGISTHTVNKHLANILRKMDASSRTEAGVRALREHLID